MNAPDAKPVYVMLILLTSSSQVHLKVLSQLAFLFQKKEFRSILEKKPGEPELITAVKKNL
jgi:mannitol/fructose-specific phosphotransferase system IIA component (Ntr-type)